ncbi:MAG: hypothetical protein ABIT01_13390 [Thermoanaerobaculia bacterium]
MKRVLPGKAVLVVVAALAFARPGAAQIESALLSKISFNLTNPGGKSLAMGGAFTAIADDATTALANPAGLGLLSSFEFGMSGKRSDDVIGLVTARSTATGTLINPYAPVRGVNSDLGGSQSSVDYAGVVIPISKRLVAAVTYAENLSFRGNPGADGYAFVELRDNRGGANRRDFLYEYREFGQVALANRLLALSMGFRVTDRIRVGAGLSLNRTTFDLEGDAAGPHRIVSRVFTTPVSVEERTVTMGVSDFGGTTAGVVLGFHADLISLGRLTVGGAFRATTASHGTLTIGGNVPAALEQSRQRRFAFAVPPDASLGLAAQPVPGLTIAIEGQWIGYSRSFDESLPVISYSGFLEPSSGDYRDGVLGEVQRPRDVIVPRIGFEYVASSEPLLLAFRVGYHREPAHGVRANVVARDATNRPFDLTDPPFSDSVRTVFDGGEPDDRFTGGLGATWKNRISFDLAFDVGRRSRQLSASVFYRF